METSALPQGKATVSSGNPSSPRLSSSWSVSTRSKGKEKYINNLRGALQLTLILCFGLFRFSFCHFMKFPHILHQTLLYKTAPFTEDNLNVGIFFLWISNLIHLWKDAFFTECNTVLTLFQQLLDLLSLDHNFILFGLLSNSKCFYKRSWKLLDFYKSCLWLC